MTRRVARSETRDVGAPTAGRAAGSTPSVGGGVLFVVAVPIGNPEDISLRALRILREVDLVACENARATLLLLAGYDIPTPCLSYRPRRDTDPIPDLVCRLQRGESIALVSDAGTPVIADPGSGLIAAAIEARVRVTAVPGPNAALAALMVSGLSAQRFVFEGFPPRGRADRAVFFEQLSTESRTIVLYETKRYLASTLRALMSALGTNRPVMLAGDLTCLSETIFRGTLGAALDALLAERHRSEYALVIAGAAAAQASTYGR